MPQFNPGEERVAIAIFPTKPAGLLCTAELWLSSDMTKVATSDGIPFTATGEDKAISLPITLPSVEGVCPVYLEVFSNGKRIARFLGDEDVVIAVPALTLSFTNPKQSDTVMWDARLYDINTHSWDKKSLRALSEPCVFHPTGNTFLLCVGEWWSGYVFGPYLVTVPELGQYTWDGKTEKFDGQTTINMPATANRCYIGGTLLDVDWEQRAKINVEETQDVSGYRNWATYFLGDAINTEEGIPLDQDRQPLVNMGRKIWALITMERYGSSWRWKLPSITYYPEYPPEAYQFTTRATVDYPPSPMIPRPKRYIYSITGNVPSFAVVALIRDSSDSEPGYWRVIGTSRATGPVTDFAGPACSGEACVYECWAHPDPNRSLPPNPAVAFLDNWERVHQAFW